MLTAQTEAAAIERIVSDALEALYAENLQILKLDVAERTICASLVAILQRSFAEHAVHAEYNRHGIYPKEIELPNAQGVPVMNRVYPDIIVHQPGHDEANIIVIEVKKSTNPLPDQIDLAKLAQIKRQIGYRHAVFLRLSAGPNADLRNVRSTWI